MNLIYIADPMCSWCYGISNELSRLKDAYSSTLGFKLVLGGLRPYNTETMADLGEMLKHHWTEVEKRSGRNFKHDILNDASFVYDTEPPSRAVVSMRHLKPNSEFDFFKDIQEAFYQKNMNTNSLDTYLALIERHEVNEDEFEESFNSDTMKEMVRKDFAFASEIGVNGFPTLLLEVDDVYHAISRGYAPFEVLNNRIQSITP